MLFIYVFTAFYFIIKADEGNGQDNTLENILSFLLPLFDNVNVKKNRWVKLSIIVDSLF